MMMLKSCIDEFKARSAYEYAIENGADVITSSCSYKYFTTPPDFQAFRDGSVAELAAGVIHANSIGNQGGSTPYIPWNISSPGNAPGAFIHPSEPVQNGGITAVHGTGAVDASKNVKSYSSRGPACWQQGYPVEKPLTNPDFWDYPYYTGKPGLLKPDWSAPTDVQTIRGGGGYSSGFSGTSAATPHAGGGLALLRCAAPNATVAEISEALQMTAEDRGTAGKDNSYGAGIIDLIAAADYLVPAVTPILHPPVIATSRGATISYEATLVNNTTSSRTVSVRLDAYLPNGSPYPNNPIKKGKLTLTPGMKVIPGSNTIPSSAPLGLYTMKLTVNELNGTFISSDTFVFAVNN
jgi:hypothetical protein